MLCQRRLLLTLESRAATAKPRPIAHCLLTAFLLGQGQKKTDERTKPLRWVGPHW